MFRTLALTLGLTLAGCGWAAAAQPENAFVAALRAADATCSPSNVSSVVSLANCWTEKERPLWQTYAPGDLDLYDAFTVKRLSLAQELDGGRQTRAGGAALIAAAEHDLDEARAKRASKALAKAKDPQAKAAATLALSEITALAQARAAADRDLADAVGAIPQPRFLHCYRVASGALKCDPY